MRPGQPRAISGNHWLFFCSSATDVVEAYSVSQITTPASLRKRLDHAQPLDYSATEKLGL
jgi:hypothetical protein